MKIVFIAGPLSSSEGKRGVEENIKKAESFQIALAEKEVYSFCPHVHTVWRGEKGGNITDEFFHNWHVAFLKNCSALIALPGWEDSRGTQQDIEEAKSFNIPIYYPRSVEDIEDVVKFIKQ